jgi:putative ABC transport system permease protein
MSIKTLFVNAINSLWNYRRRSLTTILSLAWAVTSFLLLMSYGQGFDIALREAFKAVGQDIVFMANGQTSEQKGGMRSGRSIRLEKDDAAEIKQTVPYVAAISPEIMQDAMLQKGQKEKEYMIRAVWPEYERIRNINIEAGRWLNSDDDRYARRVAVIGATLAREMFGNRPQIDQEILVNGIRFTVIGRLRTKVQLANYNRPDNECIFIPYETMQLFRNIRYPSNMVWTPITPSIRDKAVNQVREVLAGIHRFSPTDDKAVFVLEFSKFVNIIDGMSIALNILLAFIGTVTLGIGAVGLANIMLTSVIERTREIGVMKALGAKNRTILANFLLEAIFIVFIGGIAGIVIGISIAAMIGSLPFMGVMLGEELSKEYGRIHFYVSTTSILVSTMVLFTVGLFAGMIPAIRASRLDPVESLRYE